MSVLSAPKIVAVTFNGDANASAVGSFVSSVGSSSWWSTVTKDYSVGAATGQSVAVTATLESQYTDTAGGGALADGGAPTMPAFVASTVTTAAGMPAPDANTIYVFYLPSTTTVSLDGEVTCQAAGGYHNATTSGSTRILYAVIPECANATLVDRVFANETDFLTFASSHEILEAATDPTISVTQSGNSVSMTAGWYNDYLDDLTDDFAWNVASDGEVADFCVDQFSFQNPYNDESTAGSNTVQRIWSVAAAKAGTNPCLPIPTGEVYFNASPAQGQDFVIVSGTGTATTLPVNAFSDAAKTWTVVALDEAVAQGQSPALTFSFQGGTTETEPFTTPLTLEADSVSNGTTAQLSVTLNATLSDSNPYAAAFLISHDGTNLATAQNNHYWPFIVTTQALAQSHPRFQARHLVQKAAAALRARFAH